MVDKKLIWTGFMIMVMVQLLVPARWVLQSEEALQKGTPYKFRTGPIDPHDPFRGRYLRLDLQAERVRVDRADEWEDGQEVHVRVDTNEEGFAVLEEASHEPFEKGVPSFQTRVARISDPEDSDTTFLILDHPFDRYYLPEDRAELFQDRFFEFMRDTTVTTWARVRIHEGKAKLDGIYVDGQPLEDAIE